MIFVFFFQAEDGIRDGRVTGVKTCALPIWPGAGARLSAGADRLRPRHARPHHPIRRALFVSRLARLLADRWRRRGAAEIGRASCRERVWIWVRAGVLEGSRGST